MAEQLCILKNVFRVRRGRQYSLVLALSLLASALLSTSAHGQVPIAHWSFDTPAVTVDSGTGRILTASDSAGAHNATAVYAGTVNITSSPGQFGQAANFANSNGADAANHGFFEFPQLTEITGPSGGDFTVAAWVNSAQTTRSNTLLGTWIAGGAANNFTYWFSLANVDTNAASRPRAQLRSSNNPNTDIVAFTLPATDPTLDNVANSAWHHVAWTWKKDTKTMTMYVDGVASSPVVSTQTNVDILPSGSPVGHIGAKRDTNHYFQGLMDELWVFGSSLTTDEVNTLMTQNGFGPPPVPGDVDGDMDVDMDDFEPIRANFRKAVTMRNQGDLVRNNIVNFDDFHAWKTAFVVGGGSLANVDFSFLPGVPEPSSALLLVMAGGMLMVSRRRK